MYRPEIFKQDLKVIATEQQETETDIRDDDELPAMEDNTNKIQPFEPYVDAYLDSFTSHALFIFSISIKLGCYMVAYSGIHKLSNSHIFNHFFMYRPEIFKHDSNERATVQQENETDTSDDDDGLPPLEANTNRIQPFELYEDLESNSDNDDYFVGSHSSTNTM